MGRSIIISVVLCHCITACASKPTIDREAYDKQFSEMLSLMDCVTLVDPQMSKAKRTEADVRLKEEGYKCPDPKQDADYYQQELAERRQHQARSASRNSRDVWVDVDGKSRLCTASGSDVWC